MENRRNYKNNTEWIMIHDPEVSSTWICMLLGQKEKPKIKQNNEAF